MKKNRDYILNSNKLENQKAFFEFVLSFKNSLRDNLESFEINIPSFSRTDLFEFNKYKKTRLITFDSIYDYNIYSFFPNYKEYFFFTFFQNYPLFFSDNINSIFSSTNLIERDKKINFINEIEQKKIEGIFKNSNELDKNQIIKKFYSFFFNAYKVLKRSLSINIEIENSITIHHEKYENNNFQFLDKKTIQKDILSKKGLIFWENNSPTIEYELIGLSTITNEIISIMTLEIVDEKTFKKFLSNDKLDLSEKTFEQINLSLEDNKYYYFNFNIFNALMFLLEKKSTSEFIF